jgi:methylenetetrahydrofolate dehydrogenase (NADP+)/methenyltetrahydrofolate cyclohydrolase
MESIKEYVAKRKEQLKKQTNKDKALVIIQVGNNPASNSYVKGKLFDCEEIGLKAMLLKYDEEAIKNTETLIRIIEQLNAEERCTGIIVQLPLPKYIDIKTVQLAIDPKKDVDGFHPMSEHVACTPLGVINFLKNMDYNFTGKNALVIGRSDIVGKPLAQLLTNLNCTVTIAHSKTPKEDLKHHIKFADIVFTAIDKIEHYGMDYEPYFGLVPVIIDIGLGRNEQGKLKGNLSTELVEHLKEHGNFVISGIGGVGLLTRLQLLENTVNADRNKEVEKEI